MQASPLPGKRNAARELLSGVGYLGQGFRMWITSPRLMLIGAIPALIVGVLYVVGIVFLAVNLDALVVWMTPFANDWSEFAEALTRIAVTLAVIVVAVLFVAYTYTAVTLLVGDPFYERIWRAVEERLGNAPAELETGIRASIARAIGDGIRLLIPAIGVAVIVFACGFVPLVGTILAFAIGAVFGGWLLTVELSGYAFDSRGHTLGQRRRLLGARRNRSLGFGIVTYLLFLIPVAAVVVMPAAVAGAALLSRDVLAESDVEPGFGGTRPTKD